MHYSRMRTGCVLTVFPDALPPWGRGQGVLCSEGDYHPLPDQAIHLPSSSGKSE